MQREYITSRFPKRNLIGQILLKKGLINGDRLKEALTIQKRDGGLLGDILIEQGFITEESLFIALANQCSLIYIPVEKYNISKNLLKLFPKELLLKYSFIPLEIIGDVLTAAISDPFDEEAVNAIEKSISYKTIFMIGTKTQIEKIIKANY